MSSASLVFVGNKQHVARPGVVKSTGNSLVLCWVDCHTNQVIWQEGNEPVSLAIPINDIASLFAGQRT